MSFGITFNFKIYTLKILPWTPTTRSPHISFHVLSIDIHNAAHWELYKISNLWGQCQELCIAAKKKNSCSYDQGHCHKMLCFFDILRNLLLTWKYEYLTKECLKIIIGIFLVNDYLSSSTTSVNAEICDAVQCYVGREQASKLKKTTESNLIR